ARAPAVDSGWRRQPFAGSEERDDRVRLRRVVLAVHGAVLIGYHRRAAPAGDGEDPRRGGDDRKRRVNSLDAAVEGLDMRAGLAGDSVRDLHIDLALLHVEQGRGAAVE